MFLGCSVYSVVVVVVFGNRLKIVCFVLFVYCIIIVHLKSQMVASYLNYLFLYSTNGNYLHNLRSVVDYVVVIASIVVVVVVVVVSVSVSVSVSVIVIVKVNVS